LIRWGDDQLVKSQRWFSEVVSGAFLSRGVTKGGDQAGFHEDGQRVPDGPVRLADGCRYLSAPGPSGRDGVQHGEVCSGVDDAIFLGEQGVSFAEHR